LRVGDSAITYTTAIEQSGEWWIGWIEEAPGVNAQERTREELVVALEECLREFTVLTADDPTAS
jgi:predicted RNase H-like HicB family nuclease